jgi:hypothetical protein
MTIPAIIVLAISGISLLITAHDHGKPRSDNNFWISLIGTIITLGLLYWGGFFN